MSESMKVEERWRKALEGRGVKRMATKTRVMSRPPKPNSCPKGFAFNAVEYQPDDGRRCIAR